MRTLSLKIVERFPSDLRRLIESEDRLRAAGHPDEADMAFDAELDEVVCLVDGMPGAPDDLDYDEALDAVGHAVEILRARDARDARGAAGELRAEATCHGCYGDGGAR